MGSNRDLLILALLLPVDKAYSRWSHVSEINSQSINLHPSRSLSEAVALLMYTNAGM